MASGTASWRTAWTAPEGVNPHVNYEPSTLNGLQEATYPEHDEQGPVISGRLTRKHIPRTNDYQQAGDRIGISADDVRHLPPLATPTLHEEELTRLENLGKNGPREVTGKTMTHCVLNEHVA